MAEIARKKKKRSQAVIIKDAVMTGISYMIPIIVGGGVIQGFAKALGGYDIANAAAAVAASEYTFAMVVNAIGAALMTLTVPVIAAYVAFAMADKPGLAPGFAVGTISVTMNAGFLGGLVGGIFVGYVVNWAKELSKKAPKDIQSVFPIFVIPVGCTLVCGLLMWYVIGVPIAWLMTLLTDFLTHLSGGSKIVFGAVVGALMSIDHGGPICKATGQFINAFAVEGLYVPLAAKMCGGIQNPLGIVIAMFLGGKKKFTDAERSTALSGVILSCCYIQEYCIPFLVRDTWRVMVPCMCGGATASALCMFFGVECPAVHGGIFVVPMMSNPLLFILFWIIGACVTGTLYAILRRPLSGEEGDEGNAILDQLM